MFHVFKVSERFSITASIKPLAFRPMLHRRHLDVDVDAF